MCVIKCKVLRDDTVAYQNVSDPYLHQGRDGNSVVVSCFKCLPTACISRPLQKFYCNCGSMYRAVRDSHWPRCLRVLLGAAHYLYHDDVCGIVTHAE